VRETARRKRVDRETLHQIMQKNLDAEWEAFAGHPDEPKAESMLPGSFPKGRTPEQEHAASMKRSTAQSMTRTPPSNQ
jgi:hypothetical protein